MMDIPKKLLWMDLEMTGLNPNKQEIIEVAAVVTDFDFKEVASYEAVIRHDASVYEHAEQWAKDNLVQLFDESRSGSKEKKIVVAELVEFVQAHFEQPAILAGNSIHQDRRFIRACWPEVEELLHYRMLDVTTLKVLLMGTRGMSYEKGEAHRASEDIRESIRELEWALDVLKN